MSRSLAKGLRQSCRDYADVAQWRDCGDDYGTGKPTDTRAFGGNVGTIAAAMLAAAKREALELMNDLTIASSTHIARRYEAAPTAEIVDIIRTAMSEGCIRPCHVYDAVNELICRIQALENRPKRNCDVGTAEEQEVRMARYCAEHHNKDEFADMCAKCPLYKQGIKQDCAFFWGQMPYTKGGAK